MIGRGGGPLRRIRTLLGVGAVALASCSTSLAEPDGGCQSIVPRDQSARTTITQGIAGNVWRWDGFGNCSDAVAVSRTILVYQPVLKSALPSMRPDSFFADSLVGVAVDSVRSDSLGFYQLRLPAGTYSLVAREGGRLYVNLGTTDLRYVGLTEIPPNSVLRYDVSIRYVGSLP